MIRRAGQLLAIRKSVVWGALLVVFAVVTLWFGMQFLHPQIEEGMELIGLSSPQDMIKDVTVTNPSGDRIRIEASIKNSDTSRQRFQAEIYKRKNEKVLDKDPDNTFHTLPPAGSMTVVEENVDNDKFVWGPQDLGCSFVFRLRGEAILTQYIDRKKVTVKDSETPEDCSSR